MIEINSHIPTKDKITIDVDKARYRSAVQDRDRRERRRALPRSSISLVNELKKIDCFNKEVNRGATETG